MIAQQEGTSIYTKACGKVLIAGGYGVLEKNNIGLSLALENYFYCKLTHTQSNENLKVTVSSPQINKIYSYRFDQKINKLKEQSNQQNIFVENALYFALRYFNLLQKSSHFDIKLLIDKGFISQNQSSKQDQKFINYGQNYSKTGLGSSACVVVSIVSAICQFMGQKDNKNLINVISQVANLSAQKKIGSNFDISTAVFGTHLYQNILPEIAFNCINSSDWTDILKIDPQVRQLNELNDVIKNESIAFMIDISKGANTRVMVSNFLKNLRSESKDVQNEFFQSSKQITQNLYEIFRTQKNIDDTIKEMKKVNQTHRKIQQKFSKISKTPVQPEQFEQFLDELMQDKNVLYVICPGSGGFDALFLLAFKRQTKQYYENLIQSTRKKYKQKFGQDITFKLKEVNVKWDIQMQVNEEQVKSIQEFLNSFENSKK